MVLLDCQGEEIDAQFIFEKAESKGCGASRTKGEALRSLVMLRVRCLGVGCERSELAFESFGDAVAPTFGQGL